MTGSIKTKLGREMGLGPSDIVLDGDPAPPKGGGHSSPHPIFCPRIVANGWTGIKMPFGMEAGLGPGDIVLDGDPAPPPPKKGAQPPIFGHVCCDQTAGWIKMPLGVEVASTQLTLC